MAMYESEHTKFMREWLEKHPEELKVRASGQAMWWDKPPQDLDRVKQLRDARVPAKPYYYDVN